jgi:hypothetical protein
MGMSTHVVGFIPPDDHWQRCKRIRKDCIAAGIEIPDEVEKLFDGQDPENMPGREIELGSSITVFNVESREGFDVDLGKLRTYHPEVTVIRFFNSY